MSTDSDADALAHLAEPVRARLLASRRGGSRSGGGSLAEARERFSASQQDRTVAPCVSVEDIEAGGVPVRLYRPDASAPLPLHLYIHGGGFIVGSALSGEMDGVLSRRAAAAACVVASVEYRLAPEHPFPAGPEDCYAALRGLVERADELGLAPQAVSVGGASSGGNFAAALCLMARDRGGPAIMLQLLEIAGVDLTKSSHAWRNPRPEHDTTRERDLAMSKLYLPGPTDHTHPYVTPLFARDLTGLPPAYVMNAEFDPRRDECEAYVARLQDAGVHAIARTLQGHTHGSMMIPDWSPAQAWQQEADAILAAANADALAGRPAALPTPA